MQVREVEDVEQGLMQAAQRFFVLTNTDNLWKEHLQVKIQPACLLIQAQLLCIAGQLLRQLLMAVVAGVRLVA